MSVRTELFRFTGAQCAAAAHEAAKRELARADDWRRYIEAALEEARVRAITVRAFDMGDGQQRYEICDRQLHERVQECCDSRNAAVERAMRFTTEAEIYEARAHKAFDLMLGDMETLGLTVRDSQPDLAS